MTAGQEFCPGPLRDVLANRFKHLSGFLPIVLMDPLPPNFSKFGAENH